MKKTAKKRPAKKAPTKAAKAIEEALGAFKPAPANELSPSTEELVNDANDWTEYGPLGGQDEDAIAREVLGLELLDAPKMTQEEPSTPPVETEPYTAPQVTPDAPQGSPADFQKQIAEGRANVQRLIQESEISANQIRANQKLGQTPESLNAQAARSIENLIDALNFLHREGHLRKLPEKDIIILKNRIKIGRKLTEKL